MSVDEQKSCPVDAAGVTDERRSAAAAQEEPSTLSPMSDTSAPPSDAAGDNAADVDPASSTTSATTSSARRHSSIPSSSSAAAAAAAATAAPVPDVLLSLAKSARYASHLSDLLAELSAPYLEILRSNSRASGSSVGNGGGSGGGNGGGTTQQQQQQQQQHSSSTTSTTTATLPQSEPTWKLLSKIKPELDLVAALLHVILVVWREGRTLGMDVVNLQFCTGASLCGDGNDGDGAGVSGTSGIMGGRRTLAKADAEIVPPPTPKTSSPSPSPPSAAAPGNSVGENRTDVQSNQNRSLSALLCGSHSRSIAFVALTALPPYLMARCGRSGGWDDVRSVLFPSSSSASTTRHGETSAASESGSARGQGIRNGTNANVEGLRGRSRREMFEERRRRMVRMASQIESGERVEDEDSGGERDERNIDGATSTENDTIHNGIARRSASNSEGPSTTVGLARIDDDRSLRLARLRTKYFNVLQHLFRKGSDWFRQAHLATFMIPTPAHSIPRSLTNNDDNPEQQHAAADSRASLIKWILRLNLALFYLNGKYPTLAHRIAGVRLKTIGAGGNNGGTGASGVRGLAGAVSPPLADRPSYRFIGALILLEAGAALTGTMNRALVEIVHRWQMKRAARRRIGASSSQCTDTAIAERERVLDMVEKKVPSILSYEQSKREANEFSPIERATTDATLAASSCGICMHDRQHPAAPISCGHVFCWGCFLHWVTHIRQECPLCRAPAKPQEVMPLYNY